MTSTNADIWDNMQHWVPVGQVPHAGGVYGIKGLKLSVGTGPQNGSVLSSGDRDVASDKDTVLFLVPQAATTSTAKNDGASPQHSLAAGSSNAPQVTEGSRSEDAGAAPSNQDEAEKCEPPECSIDLPVTETESAAHPVTSFSILKLG
jgi:hypothetical protein